MYEIQIGDTLEADFSTHNDAGANANADSTPTFTVYKNGTAVVALTSQNATNYGTGLYRCLAAITSANGFATGDKVSIVATATVGGDTSSVVLKVAQVVAITLTAAAIADAIVAEVLTQPTSGAPPASPTVGQALMYPYVALVNDKADGNATDTVAPSQRILYDTAGDPIAKATISTRTNGVSQGKLGAP